MSSKSGYLVFTATPEMAKQMPKVFKAGATYVAEKASAVGPTVTTTLGVRKKASKKKAKVAKKKAKASKKVAKKATKKATKKVKATRRKTLKPEIIISFIKSNAGCNMTDIERSIKQPQAVIRRVLTAARESGVVRTEGQRRGLRYFDGASKQTVGAGADQN